MHQAESSERVGISDKGQKALCKVSLKQLANTGAFSRYSALLILVNWRDVQRKVMFNQLLQ